jgi:hypothetical protein
MAPQAQPIVTVAEVDEAIWWVLMTAPRKLDHMRIVDALLDQRLALMTGRQDPSAHPPGSSHRHEDHHGARPTR